MKTFNTYFESLEELKRFKITNFDDNYNPGNTVLIQIFSGITNQSIVRQTIYEIKKVFPFATIIGTSTAGEIMNGTITNNKIVLSISVFETTTINSFMLDTSWLDEQSIALEIKSNIKTNETKAIILFANTKNADIENILTFLDAYCPQIPIAGGIAGDSFNHEQQLVFSQEGITDNGIVAVSLNSKQLTVESKYFLNWRLIGKTFMITDAYKNLVKTIDNVPAGEIIRKYLGHDIANNLPRAGLEFPLIFYRNRMYIARKALEILPDNTLVLAGNVTKGDEFKLSYGLADSIISRTVEKIESLKRYPIESIFVYSCASRKNLLGEKSGQETLALQQIAPSSGFFAYGEFFYRQNHTRFLNKTMTTLLLWENTDGHRPLVRNYRKDSCNIQQSETKVYSVLNVLDYLISKVTDELKQTNKNMNVLVDELQEKNKIIDYKSRNTTDSINYAFQIQKAILPPPEQLEKVLNEYFIFYQPKDIVSGDFYWVAKNGSKIFFAVGDCTGHGVPGAFMSILGTSLLNEIYSSYIHWQFAKPNTILNQLRQRIIECLHQTGKSDEGKDGMDISFCMLDYETHTLHYAGANQPLIMVRNNKPILFDADKMPIGIHTEHERMFTNQSISVEEGDMIYLCSDGFSDQFGGQKRKKYLKKRLFDLFAQISNQTIDDQHQSINDEFQQWKGSIEQIDDVTIMGIRISFQQSHVDDYII